MAKPHSDTHSATGNGSRPTFPMIEALQPEVLTESCNRLLKHAEEINRAWVGSLQQASDSGWTLAGRLARCSDPMEASRLYSEWLNERRDALLADGKRLTEMWLKAYESDFGAAPGRSFPGDRPSAVSRMAAAE